MRSNYATVQPWILAYEGGYVDHPKDPGGATMQGITQATYDAYRRRVGKDTRFVRQLQAIERDTIYRVQYWDKISGDDLPSGVDAFVYDFAVNSGPSRAAKALQAALGVRQDGVIGLRTLDAAAAADPVAVIEAMADARMSFLRRLRTWRTFGKGWSRRVVGERPGAQDYDTGILDRATKLARGAKTITAPKIKGDGAGAKADLSTGFWARLFEIITGKG